MKRGHVSWSNFTDYVEGPCVVCGVEVRFVIPSDKPSPSLLYHPTCDMMPAIREQLKSAKPPALPPEYVIPRKAAPAPAAAPASAPALSAAKPAAPSTPPATPPAAS